MKTSERYQASAINVLAAHQHQQQQRKPRVRMKLSNADFRKRLINLGVMPDAVNAKIAEITDPKARAIAQTEWEYAAEIHRTHPMVMALAPAFGFSPEQLDTVFQ